MNNVLVTCHSASDGELYITWLSEGARKQGVMAVGYPGFSTQPPADEINRLHMKRNATDHEGGFLPNKQRRVSTETPAGAGFTLPPVDAHVSPFSVPGVQKRNIDDEDTFDLDQPSKRLRTVAFPTPVVAEPAPVTAPQPSPVGEQPQPATYNPAEMQLVCYVAPPGPFGNNTDTCMDEQPQAYPPLDRFIEASRRQSENTRREVFPLIRLPQCIFDNAPPPQNEVVVYAPLTTTMAGPQLQHHGFAEPRPQAGDDYDSSDGESMQLD